jgi:hypothetical protein
VSKEDQEATANWLILVGALALFGSLFLTWSHQLTTPLLTVFGPLSPALQGVPADPTAWQVYSAADVVLALLAAGLVASAVIGSRAARQCAAVAAVLAVIFVVHAIAAPPTNGVLLSDPSQSIPNYLSITPGAGVGETVALLALLLALAGLLLSLWNERMLTRASVAA